jgi:hypothetical protein
MGRQTKVSRIWVVNGTEFCMFFLAYQNHAVLHGLYGHDIQNRESGGIFRVNRRIRGDYFKQKIPFTTQYTILQYTDP